MEIRGMLFAATACAVLLGCQTVQQAGTKASATVKRAPTGTECNAEPCNVTVYVMPKPDGGNTLSVSDEVVFITDKKAVTVTWKLDDPAFAFDKKYGILIQSDKKGEFKCKIDQQDSTVFTCTNKHQFSGLYKYSVNVIGADPLDPFLVNN
jgi:hypothetical protein